MQIPKESLKTITIDILNEVSFFIFYVVIFSMLSSVVIELADEYVDNDLIYLSEKGLFGLTQLGGIYCIALLIAMKRMDEGYTPLEPVIYHNYPEDALISAANGSMTLTRVGIDWTVQYMADHKFNKFVYDVARKIYEKNIKENI